MNEQGKSILLVDDDQDYKYFFYKALEKADPSATVTDAVDGIDALNKLKEADPDIIVLDFNMPRMNGMAFLKQIKSDRAHKHIPVVIYSTFLSMFDADEIKKLGAVHVYNKPVGFQETVNMVCEILNLCDGIRSCA
jgi:CheY-like chemotaxis protein